MGTQRETADLIAEKNGHYLLALKNSQQSLYEDVECAFKCMAGMMYTKHMTQIMGI
jgi:predicted transposase YbfD/YdcC